MYRTAEFQGRSSLTLDRAVSTLKLGARCVGFLLFVNFVGDVVALCAQMFDTSARWVINATNNWVVLGGLVLIIACVLASVCLLCALFVFRACARGVEFLRAHTHVRFRQVVGAGALAFTTYTAVNWYLATPSWENTVLAVALMLACHAFVVHPILVMFLRLCRRADARQETVGWDRSEWWYWYGSSGSVQDSTRGPSRPPTLEVIINADMIAAATESPRLLRKTGT